MFCFCQNRVCRFMLCLGQRGSAGLETSIVLVTFVVVSTVFGLAALSAGENSNGKTEETIRASFDQTRIGLELKGTVVITASIPGASGTVSNIAFQVANTGGKSVDLTPGTTLIKYSDRTQSKMFTSAEGFTATGLGLAKSGKLLERDEVYLLKLIDLDTSLGPGLNTLTNKLGPDTAFNIEVIPPTGPVLVIKRRTPISLDASMSLR